MMALLMFVTSVGLTVDIHYCKGQFKNFNLLGKAKSCHEIGQGMKTCPHHQKMRKERDTQNHLEREKNCCSSKTLYLQSDQDQLDQTNQVTPTVLQLYVFFVAWASVFFNVTDFTSNSLSFLTHHEHPFFLRDIYALLETFRL